MLILKAEVGCSLVGQSWKEEQPLIQLGLENALSDGVIQESVNLLHNHHKVMRCLIAYQMSMRMMDSSGQI